MENTNIFLENGSQTQVNGIFYIFNSRYYFIYTLGEKVDNDYIQLYVVQVCKEVKKTENGPVDTGYMLGIETPNSDEWAQVQQSITKIVENKKNEISDPQIQFLPINMLINLKIVSKNKFKLMASLLNEAFNLNFMQDETIQSAIDNTNSYSDLNLSTEQNNFENQTIQSQQQNTTIMPDTTLPSDGNSNDENIIIDYRTKFFEVQDKNKQLEEQIKILQEKLNSIKSII